MKTKELVASELFAAILDLASVEYRQTFLGWDRAIEVNEKTFWFDQFGKRPIGEEFAKLAGA